MAVFFYARRLARIEAAKAKERMIAGKAQDPTDNSPQGETREIVAKQLGTSSNTIAREQFIENNRDLLDPADFAEWDEGKLHLTRSNRVPIWISENRIIAGHTWYNGSVNGRFISVLCIGGLMLLTTSEYARAYNTNDRAARKLCEDGEVRCIRVGRDWLIQADAKAQTKEDTK